MANICIEERSTHCPPPFDHISGLSSENIACSGANRPHLDPSSQIQELSCLCCLENTSRNSLTLCQRNNGTKVSRPNSPAVSHLVHPGCCNALCCTRPSTCFAEILRTMNSLLAAVGLSFCRKASCCPEPNDHALPVKAEPATDAGPRQVISMMIEGMDCPACTPRVERALKALRSVEDVKVSLRLPCIKYRT